MGEVIDLNARRQGPTLEQVIARHGYAVVGETQRVPPGSIAHRVERRSERNRWQVWTLCGTRILRDAPGRDTDLVCLRCFPWWRA